MNVSIIGGGGLVGSCAAFALQAGKLVREIVLIDANADLADGQALDLLHGSSVTADQVIAAGDYEHIPESDCVCITAGLRRKPDESRLDLINRNVELFQNILAAIQKAGVRQDAVVLVVSNPVDILTYVSVGVSGLPPGRIIGSGTILDTSRFRFLLGQYYGVDARSVHAYIIGEHGDSEIPVWSSASIGGVRLQEFAPLKNREYVQSDMDALFAQVRVKLHLIMRPDTIPQVIKQFDHGQRLCRGPVGIDQEIQSIAQAGWWVVMLHGVLLADVLRLRERCSARSWASLRRYDSPLSAMISA